MAIRPTLFVSFFFKLQTIRRAPLELSIGATRSYCRVVGAMKVIFHAVGTHVLRRTDFVTAAADKVRRMSANTQRMRDCFIDHMIR
jgi:hypothetical protein